MSNSPAPGSQLADYFFVAGLHDDDLLATYQAAKQGRRITDDDYYYERQQTAVNDLDKKNNSNNSDSNQVVEASPTPLDEPNNSKSSSGGVNHHTPHTSSTSLSPRSDGGSSSSKNSTTTTTTSTNGNGDNHHRALPTRTVTLPAELHSGKNSSGRIRDSSFGVLDHVQAVIDHFDKERDTARDTVIAVHDQHRLAEKFDTHQQDQEQQRRQRSSSTHVAASDRYSLHQSHTWQPESGSSTRRQRQYSEPPAWMHGTQSSIDSVATVTPKNLQENNPNAVAVPNILDLQYIPTVLMRYPKQNCVPSQPFPPYVAMFCFPKEITLHYGSQPPPERLHSFAMTDEKGATINGTCVVFYERLPERLIKPVDEAIQDWVEENMASSTVEYAQHLQTKINEEEAKRKQHGAQLASLTTLSSTSEIQQQREQLEELVRSAQENVTLYTELLEPVKMGVCTAQNVWVPKSVGLLGCMPWNDLYGDWLRVLVDAVVGVRGHRHKGVLLNVESAVHNIIREVPLPPPGRFEIGLSINHRPLFFSRPPVNQVPLLKNFSLYPVFRALSPHLILAITETLLAEGKVLFLSQYAGMLSLACETFRYLLFPLYWQFVFIPVLPRRLLTCLQAPVPYIVGFMGDMSDVEDYIAEDTCIVNLDSNTMHQYHATMTIPDRQRKKLYTAIEQYAPLHGSRHRIPYGVPLSIKEMFPNSRMLLSCGRSKVQNTYDAPQRTSNTSEFSNSIWSNNTTVASGGTSGRPLSGLWSSNASTRSSNDSSTSLSTSLDVPLPAMPQYPGSVKLATQGSASTSSLHTPPMSPTASKNRLHHHHHHPSTSTQRSSMTTTGVQRHGSTRSNRSDVIIRRAETSSQTGIGRLSRQSSSSDSSNSKDVKTKRRLSTFMSKPRAAFQQNNFSETSVDTAASPRNSTASSPYSQGYNQEYAHQQNCEVMRRIKHIEGHIMTEVFSRELLSLQGYRCLCGKPVSEFADGEDTRVRQRMFMRCQECQLVTHDNCTNQILHACLPACFNERKVQEAFLRMFASLLYNYRTGFVDDTQELNGAAALASTGDYSKKMQRGVLYFSKEKFMKHSDKDTRPYLSHLVGSQMFTQFITDRLSKSAEDPEILVFDEFIKLKLNRSRLKFVKEDTPFLNDDSFSISQTIWATPPSDAAGQTYDRFPIDLELLDKS
ncbi:AEX-3 domain-containing protein [Zychaea mexicana]|uniref:AEX-3 domain-containing protein n=1 Tax=Zychaea mexicana TaxID=64656 RepID=UPI0022FEC46C|nr:AEX-3 domain-containing protein [Zychaea mexicana]KAI9495919.1 AEX-3 domain-containing protein [Zychaea mexicana]